MRTTLTFIGSHLLSLFVALTVGIILADHFKAREEFIAVIMALILFSWIATIVFVVVYLLAARVGTIGYAATGLAAGVAVLVMLPSFFDNSPNRANEQDYALLAELLLPTALMLTIQWAVIRRRWLAVRATAMAAPP